MVLSLNVVHQSLVSYRFTCLLEGVCSSDHFCLAAKAMKTTSPQVCLLCGVHGGIGRRNVLLQSLRDLEDSPKGSHQEIPSSRPITSYECAHTQVCPLYLMRVRDILWHPIHYAVLLGLFQKKSWASYKIYRIIQKPLSNIAKACSTSRPISQPHRTKELPW